jgi:hypothetical protein
MVLVQRARQLSQQAAKQCQVDEAAGFKSSSAASWHVTAQQQEDVLHLLLQETLRLSAEQSRQVAQQLTSICSKQGMLMHSVAACFGLRFDGYPASAAASDDDNDDDSDTKLDSDALQKWAAATSVLVEAFWGQAVGSTLMPCVLQQPKLRQLLLQYFFQWSGDVTSSSSNDSTSSREAASALERALAKRAVAAPATIAAAAATDQEAAAAAASPAEEHGGGFRLLRGMDVAKPQLLLAPLQTALCSWCSRLLTELDAVPLMLQHLASTASHAASAEECTAEIERLLCNRRMTARHWLQLYCSNEPRIKLHARFLRQLLGTLGNVYSLLASIGHEIHSLATFGVAAFEVATMLGEQAEFAGVSAAAQRDKQQQQQQGGQEAAADGQHSSSSSSSGQDKSYPNLRNLEGATPELPQAAAAAAAAGAAVAQGLQTLRCAGPLTYKLWKLSHDLLTNAEAALRAATAAAGSALVTTALPELSAAAAPAEIAAAQDQVRQALRGDSTACAKMQCVQSKVLGLDLAASVDDALKPAAAALGLELLSSMGLWVVPDVLPRSLAEAAAAQQPAPGVSARHSSSSSSSSSRFSTGRSVPAEASGDNCDSKQAAAPGTWISCSGDDRRLQVLKGFAGKLKQEDVSNLQVLLEGISSGGYNSSSSRSAVKGGAATCLPAVAVSGSSGCRGFACNRLAQLMQLHASAGLSDAEQAAADAAAAAGPHSSLFRLLRALEAIQPEKDDNSSTNEASEEQKRLSNSMQNAVWRLLLAVKPPVAAALHCGSIPPACRSYEAFERAVLGWLPQQEPAAAAADVASGDQQQQQQHGCKDSRRCSKCKSKSRCSCGKEGHAYTLPASGAVSMPPAVAAAEDSHQCAVCGVAACVARELQQLAQQGPPAVLGEVAMHLVLRLLHGPEGLLLLPTEFR